MKIQLIKCNMCGKEMKPREPNSKFESAEYFSSGEYDFCIDCCRKNTYLALILFMVTDTRTKRMEKNNDQLRNQDA